VAAMRSTHKLRGSVFVFAPWSIDRAPMDQHATHITVAALADPK